MVAAEQDVAAVQPLLPYFIRFGVNSPGAAYLRLLGVSDRRGAFAISQQFPAELDQNYESVEAWTRSESGRAAIRDYYADDLLARTTTERDLGLEGDPRALPVFFSAEGDRPDWIRPGSTLRIEHVADQDWWARDLVSRATWRIDGVPGEGVAVVSRLDRDRIRGVLFAPA
jgi:hypothetical protein